MLNIATRYGPMDVPSVDTDIIGRFLSRYGEWAWDEVGFVASAIPDTARVLDIGAFIGTFGLGLGLRRQLGFLCFVEANPAIARLLEHNAARNAPSAVVVEAMVAEPGAQPRAGHAKDGNLGATSFSLNTEGAITSDSPSRAVTLAGLRAEYGEFDLIKLDAEGMEHEILRSDTEYLSTGKATLWVECNEDQRSLAVAELLLSWGIDLHYFAFPAYNPNNLRNDPDPIFPLAYEAGLLAAPKVQPRLDAELEAHRCILRPVRTVEDLKNALWRTPRWGMAEWANASPDELAALAGRSLRGEKFETFLTSADPTRPSPGETVWQRLEVTQQGLLTAETLAFERLGELADERERRERVEDGLRVAQALAIERLADLNTERERAASLEATLAQTNARALVRLSEIGAARERAEGAETALNAERAAAKAYKQSVDDMAQERVEEAETALNAERAAAEAYKQSVDDVARKRAREVTAALHAGWAAAETYKQSVHDAARAQVEAAEARVRAAEAYIASFEASTMWRLSAPVRRFVEARPGLHTVLRRGRTATALILKRKPKVVTTRDGEGTEA